MVWFVNISTRVWVRKLFGGKHKIWNALLLAFRNNEAFFLPPRHLFNNVFALTQISIANQSNSSRTVFRHNNLAASAPSSTWDVTLYQRADATIFLRKLFENSSFACVYVIRYRYKSSQSSRLYQIYPFDWCTKEQIWDSELKVKYLMVKHRCFWKLVIIFPQTIETTMVQMCIFRRIADHLSSCENQCSSKWNISVDSTRN